MSSMGQPKRAAFEGPLLDEDSIAAYMMQLQPVPREQIYSIHLLGASTAIGMKEKTKEEEEVIISDRLVSESVKQEKEELIISERVAIAVEEKEEKDEKKKGIKMVDSDGMRAIVLTKHVATESDEQDGDDTLKIVISEPYTLNVEPGGILDEQATMEPSEDEEEYILTNCTGCTSSSCLDCSRKIVLLRM
jgi:hypothetical protein